MKTSPFLDEIYLEGRTSGLMQCRAELIATVRSRIGSTIPDDILRRIEGEQDFARLMRWFAATRDASSFDELRGLLVP